ncbi:DUF2004 domain-containing protein [Acinetobacter sp. YK3]|uniref:DUF2004 domain-containing protein n=1 Tax=Acinetobacter sp. YK3 TaxID=1860097 RepID=UPI00084C30F0|nr:DUF2004 domain-containing protein [Acinetobacter sp. YK3]OEC88854.1 hypothetical protein A9Z07_08410 [Acinetobacter sp. YK3]
MSEQAIVKGREQLARAAMRAALENQQAEDSVELFIQHHLEEIEPDYWKKYSGSALPTPLQVLDLLVLAAPWESDEIDSREMLDFTLPDEITQYVICVSFDAKGQVIDILMES